MNKIDEFLMVFYFNEMMTNSIIHGGDSGGAYCSNTDGLRSVVEHFVKEFNLSDFEIDWDDDYYNIGFPKIYNQEYLKWAEGFKKKKRKELVLGE